MKKVSIIAGVIFLILVVTSLQGLPRNTGPKGKGGQGCVKVKSADNEFIGTLIDFTGQDNVIPSNVLVFIPSLGKFFQFSPTDGSWSDPLKLHKSEQ